MTTPDPFRLRLLQAMTAAFDEIDGTDGIYHYDLRPFQVVRDGKKVMQKRNFRGRVVFGDKDPLPMTSILEEVLQPEQFRSSHANPYRTGPWALIIQVFVEDDLENPTDPAQRLISDVQTRIALEIKKINDRKQHAFGFKAIKSINLGPPVVRPPDEISSKAYGWLPVALDIVEDLSQPSWTGPTN